jgi:hypothetical protein
MSFLQWFLGKKELPKTKPDIRFGRFTDAYKTAKQLAHWENARLSFEQENFFASCKELLQYILDERENNVSWNENENNISFSIVQGSQKITGNFSHEMLSAEVAVAKANSLNVGLLRRLIDQTTTLSYTSYALTPDNVIVIRFSTSAADGSPYKVFFGLKEMATNADKQDDLLLHDFDTLQIVDKSLRMDISDDEKNIKYNFLVAEIQDTFSNLERLKVKIEQQPKTASYLMLDTIYKIEYLICPEGYTLDTLEQAQLLYFLNDNKNIEQKNNALKKTLQQLLEFPKEVFYKEMYRTKAAFGVAQSVSHDAFVQQLDSELPQIDWYLRSEQERVSEAICNNIVGFCSLNCTLPKPNQALFHLYFEILEANFFQKLGFDTSYYNEDKSFNVKNIKATLQLIAEDNKIQYPKCKPSTEILDFSSRTLFAKSYLMMIRNLDLSRA